MKLFEYEGKERFKTYGIPVLESVVIDHSIARSPLSFPVILKAQVRATDRKAAGGVLIAKNDDEFVFSLKELLGKTIHGEIAENVLVERCIDVAAEYYVSFSYDSRQRGPVLSLSPHGGSGICEARVYVIDVLSSLERAEVSRNVRDAGFSDADVVPVSDIVLKLWELFNEEKAIMAEINPIIKNNASVECVSHSRIVCIVLVRE